MEGFIEQQHFVPNIERKPAFPCDAPVQLNVGFYTADFDLMVWVIGIQPLTAAFG
jgi:hypothetical protein